MVNKNYFWQFDKRIDETDNDKGSDRFIKPISGIFHLFYLITIFLEVFVWTDILF